MFCTYFVFFQRYASNGNLNRGPTANTVEFQQEEETDCQNEISGLFAYPSDCSKFVNCIEGVKTVQDCPPYTAFNSKISACDHIINADCSNQSGGKRRDGSSPTNNGEGRIDVRMSTHDHEQQLHQRGREQGNYMTA